MKHFKHSVQNLPWLEHQKFACLNRSRERYKKNYKKNKFPPPKKTFQKNELKKKNFSRKNIHINSNSYIAIKYTQLQ